MPKLQTSLVAAATPARYRGVSRVGNIVWTRESDTRTEKKQKRAWGAYDNIGEIHYLCSGLIGSAIETLAWYGAVEDSATTYTYAVPVEEAGSGISAQDAASIQTIIAGIKPLWGQQQDYMRALAVNLLVAGEIYVYTRNVGGDATKWIHELVPRSNVTLIQQSSNGKSIQEFKDPVTGAPIRVGDGGGKLDRIYRPHPGRLGDADSPLFAVLDLLDELEWIQRVIDNVFRKRLLSSGVFVISNSMLGPDYNPNLQTSTAGGNSKVEADFIRQMSGNIDPNTDSPAGPIFLFSPFAEVKEGFNYIEFNTELSESIIAERREVLRRIANSLDVPAEFLLGIGEANHWSAWLIRDLLWQNHLQPLATLIANSLTVTFLRPALKALKADGLFSADPDNIKLWFQASSLQSHPDLFEFLMTGHDAGLIGKQPILRALGIPPDAAITDEEFEQWLELKKNEQGGVPPGEVSDDGTRQPFPPSREPTGTRRRPRSQPANEDRNDEDGPAQR